jgi:hypothetical protein
MKSKDHTLKDTLKTIMLEVIEEIFVNSTSPQEFEAELRWAASRRLIIDKVQFEESYSAIEDDASYRVVTMKLSPFLLNYDYDETTRLSNLTWDFFINVDDEKLDFEDPYKTNQLAEHCFIEIVDDYEARNARTSVQMIEKFYASNLTSEMNIGLIQSRRSMH